jgi:hypothetical protein
MIRKSVIRRVALFAAMVGVFGLRAAGDSEGLLAQQLRIAEVAVTIDEKAYIDWNRRSSAIHKIQNDIIRQVFRTAALDGAERTLSGDRLVVLSINVTYFDILSDLELLFCCARNEVMADYLLVDAETGEALAGGQTLNFDHVGRGGFLALLDQSSGEDQLSRLFDMIAEGTSDWLTAKH